MLLRLTQFLPRGSATYPFRSRINPTVRTRKFPLSTSPTSRHRGAYYFCAVGGIVVVAASGGEKDMSVMDLPGRPGNLTDEQTIKLKEMWSTTFKLFGIPREYVPPGSENEAEPNNGVLKAETDMSGVQQKKGKLASLFNKKKDPDPQSLAPSTETPNDFAKLSIAAGEDKYSQTKQFKEVLATSSPQEIHDTFWRMVKADHPDSLFLRFLRARKWDVNKAIVMLVATLRWRSNELDVDAFRCVMLMIG